MSLSAMGLSGPSAEDFLREEAVERFYALLRVGRGSPIHRPKPILALGALTALVPVAGESPGGLEDVRVDLIVGTEDRSEDFAEGFYPKRAWMEPRWVKVYILMKGDAAIEPVELIEYGGSYFVRDGNHRVSVARHSGVEYLRASVAHCRVPARLPPYLEMGKLEIFKEKCELQSRWGLFDHVDDAEFNVRKPGTWASIERSIFVDCRERLVRKGELDDSTSPAAVAAILGRWMTFYRFCVERIRSEGFMVLFPELLDTDIFVELTEYWRSFEDPASIWFGEVFNRFKRRVRLRRMPLAIAQAIRQVFLMLKAPTEDVKRYFLRASRVERYAPGFAPPAAGKLFYGRCYRQVFIDMPRLRKPGPRSRDQLEDIVSEWYQSFYAPVLDRYEADSLSLPFGRFYGRFSRFYFKEIILGRRSVGDCAREFVRKFAGAAAGRSPV